MKLQDRKGETLAETLMALLIITIVITGFAEVITKMVKVNNTIKSNRINYNFNGDIEPTTRTWSITINGNENRAYDTSKINFYVDGNLYHYESE